MNKYIYIGTDEQLKQMGFRLTNDIDIKAIRPNKNKSSNTFIENNNNVVFWNKEDIEDLVFKNLIIEVK